jgi:LacI family transcriptional regulator
MMPLAPLLYEDGSLENELGKWFDRETPDALIIHASTIGEITVDVLSLEVPGPVAIACVTYPISYWAGMNEHPELVGATAIDQLSSMILHGEQGLPEGTSTIMIDGAWHEGESIQPKV